MKTDTLTKLTPVSKQQVLRDNLEVALDCRLYERGMDFLIKYINLHIQAAFRRGRGERPSDGESDSVSHALKAGITDPHTLAVIYAKEMGFEL